MSTPRQTNNPAQNYNSHARPSPQAPSSTRASAVPSLFPGRQWQQVLQRDASADGQFFYAVKSTGIYCRPSCPSRRPARQNVRFFPTASAAEQAGFRACKRCRPELATPRPDPQAELIASATDYLAHHATERIRLADLARVTGVGRLTLLRGFRRVLGVSPGEFARAQRVARFKDSLRPAMPPVASVIKSLANPASEPQPAPSASPTSRTPSAPQSLPSPPSLRLPRIPPLCPPTNPSPPPSASPTPFTSPASAPPAASTSPATIPWE